MRNAKQQKAKKKRIGFLTKEKIAKLLLTERDNIVHFTTGNDIFAAIYELKSNKETKTTTTPPPTTATTNKPSSKLNSCIHYEFFVFFGRNCTMHIHYGSINYDSKRY